MAELTYEVSFKGVASPTLRAAFMDCELTAAIGSHLRALHQGIGAHGDRPHRGVRPPTARGSD